MNDDPGVEYSKLSGIVSTGGKRLIVQIYRIEGESTWVREVEDEHGNSTVCDEPFESDATALKEAKRAILKDTAGAFVGPEDGKSIDDWRQSTDSLLLFCSETRVLP